MHCGELKTRGGVAEADKWPVTPASADKVEGFLEVGYTEAKEVVINLPADKTGHLVFSVNQARGLAATLFRKAAEAEGWDIDTIHIRRPDGKLALELPPDFVRIPTPDANDHLWVSPATAERIRSGETVSIADLHVTEKRVKPGAMRPRILFKIPSRARPQILADTLRGWMERQSTDQVDYLLSLDEDDRTLAEYRKLCDLLPKPVLICEGRSPNKIHAVNRDMDRATHEWDILVNGSDDMVCIEQGWDSSIIADMGEAFPALDGALHYADGNRTDLITLSIMGRRLYEAFGYIYHPAYASLWSDNEFTDTVRVLKRYHFANRALFKHRHRSVRGGLANDPLYERNERYFHQDEKTYQKRKAVDFDIHRVAINLERMAT
jgi:hypothetical protein